MDSILVINAGSSSVKFEVFAVDGSAKLTRKIKGQIDGIGTRPRLRARRGDGASLVDREYDSAAISDVPRALHTAGAWLREEQRMPPSAVGHRVVHGGPEYDKPVLINAPRDMAEAARRVPQGMNDTQKQDYLAQAERHVAMAEDRIAWQKRIIDKLAQAGQETDCAVSMLHALETCLHALEQHRETLFERCKT
jgi:Acetokinase family